MSRRWDLDSGSTGWLEAHTGMWGESDGYNRNGGVLLDRYESELWNPNDGGVGGPVCLALVASIASGKLSRSNKLHGVCGDGNWGVKRSQRPKEMHSSRGGASPGELECGGKGGIRNGAGFERGKKSPDEDGMGNNVTLRKREERKRKERGGEEMSEVEVRDEKLK